MRFFDPKYGIWKFKSFAFLPTRVDGYDGKIWWESYWTIIVKSYNQFSDRDKTEVYNFTIDSKENRIVDNFRNRVIFNASTLKEDYNKI